MYLKTLNLRDIHPYERNPRINDKAVEPVMKSIQKDGYRARIIVDKDGVIIAGHTRYEAMKRLGWTEAEVWIADDMTPEQIADYRIRDNLTADFAEWDFSELEAEIEEMDLDFDMSEFEGFEDIQGGVSDTPTAEEDDFDPEEPVEPKAKPGDIYQLGQHRLICGDSTDVAVIDRLMDGVKADMAFTDPPYGVKYTGGLQFKDGYVEKNNREMIKNDDTDIYGIVFYMLSRYVNGACYVWFADTKAKTLYENADRYGDIHALIIWVKNGGYGALNANYKQKHEPCLYWNPKGTTLRFIGATTETTVWDINKDGVNEYHPTQKPVALAAKAIQNHDARTVLDLFGGSGSTLIACEQLNRKCYMCELDPHYVDVIIARWENLTGEKAVLVNG